MESIANWFNSWREIGTEQLQSFVAYLPSLLGAIALLLLGWLVARFLRIVVRRLGNGINEVLDGVLAQGHLDRVRLSAGALRIAETIVYWIAVLFFVAEAACPSFKAIPILRRTFWMPWIRCPRPIFFVPFRRVWQRQW